MIYAYQNVKIYKYFAFDIYLLFCKEKKINGDGLVTFFFEFRAYQIVVQLDPMDIH